MSLQVDEERRRGRSKSPGRRAEERDRSPAPPPPNIITATREPSYAYPEDDLDERYGMERRGTGGRGGGGGGIPYPEDDHSSAMPGSRSLYEFDDRKVSSSYRDDRDRASPPRNRDSYYRASRDKVDDYRSSKDKVVDVEYRGSRDKVDMEYRSSREKVDRDDRDKDYRSSRGDRYADEPQVRTVEPRESGKERRDKPSSRYDAKNGGKDSDDDKDKLSYLPQKYNRKYDKGDEPEVRFAEPRRDRDRDSDRDREKDRGKSRYEDDLAYGSAPLSPRDDLPNDSKYGRPKYSSSSGGYRGRDESPDRNPPPTYGRDRKSDRDSLSADPRSSAANVLTVSPETRRGKSPQPPTNRMSRLEVNTGHHSMGMSLSVSNAPASPLLESYKGTYQDMSPMPSPLLLASAGPSDSAPNVIDALSPLSGGSSDDDDGKGGKKKRRARFHDDAEDNASRLAKALKGERKPPDVEPLIEILPGLSHEQIMQLRSEYKRLVKTGSERKGVNIAKHIRARLKDEDPNLMKACYAVALGQWESEAYWANFWYQGDKTRRELLIEALMGRTNEEIHNIKAGFSDKKYDNSLAKCMRQELKEDKFKKAVLAVLEEKRMPEVDDYGRRIPIDSRLVEEDVVELRKAVKAEKGGESLMISIVVKRSDPHLREVLKLYEKSYRGNFAREALKKSGNLVGELLAHILNGVINKPVRDALLLNHALTASRKDGLRRELLISRLVRYHWDPQHMAAVKRAYRERYGQDLQDAVKEGTSGDWGHFCWALCITRMPNDTKTVERIEIRRSERSERG